MADGDPCTARQRNAFHEAGHAIVQLLVGEPPGHVTIKAGADHDGRTAISPIRVNDYGLDAHAHCSRWLKPAQADGLPNTSRVAATST